MELHKQQMYWWTNVFKKYFKEIKSKTFKPWTKYPIEEIYMMIFPLSLLIWKNFGKFLEGGILGPIELFDLCGFDFGIGVRGGFEGFFVMLFKGG